MEIQSKSWPRRRAGVIGLTLGLTVAVLTAAGLIVFAGLSADAAHGSRGLELGIYVLIAAGVSIVVSLVVVAALANVLDAAAAFVWGAAAAAAIVVASVVVGWSEAAFTPASSSRVIFGSAVLAGFLIAGGGLAVAFRALGLLVRPRKNHRQKRPPI